MEMRAAPLRLLVGISAMVGSTAMAHIDYKGDFECKANYEKDCILWNADLDQRTIRIFFDGTVAENGKRCEVRTSKLAIELGRAVINAGGTVDDLAISSVRAGALGAGGIANEYRCSYEVVSKRKDLRFEVHHFNRRFWTSAEEQDGVCMDDVHAAESIPGSIGAAKWITAALFQGYMCNTNYATLGFDREITNADGTKTLLKYGQEPSTQRASAEKDSHSAQSYGP